MESFFLSKKLCQTFIQKLLESGANVLRNKVEFDILMSELFIWRKLMLSKVLSFGLNGIDGLAIEIESDIVGGLPHFDIVGLGDTAVKEAKERVKSAIRNSGYEYPAKHYTINLAPADLKKEGPQFDLGIAVGILSASEQITIKKYKDFVFLGELSLDGSIKRVRGVLPILISALKNGLKKIILPKENAEEARFIKGLEIYAFGHLREVVDFLQEEDSSKYKPVEAKSFEDVKVAISNKLDFENVKGQKVAKRALEIAAAGGHNVIMVGPPGSGKSMLAKCFSGILPDLTFEEALEVTKIHSVAGVLDLSAGIITERPFRTPHHTATTISLTGGGSHSKPGEISLAHNGVLYLDEFPEYSRQLIETLRQPLEDGTITVARANQTVTYPSSFTLIASMNPCPCGNYGAKDRECKCSPVQIHKYLAKISGPIMDRIDIQVEVDNIAYSDLHTKEKEECSADIKKRVDGAREIQLKRFEGTKTFSNAKMSVAQTKKFCTLSSDCQTLMEQAFSTLKLSARAHDRILRVARTIADLEGESEILPQHLAEAISYRGLDRKYWSV